MKSITGNNKNIILIQFSKTAIHKMKKKSVTYQFWIRTFLLEEYFIHKSILMNYMQDEHGTCSSIELISTILNLKVII